MAHPVSLTGHKLTGHKLAAQVVCNRIPIEQTSSSLFLHSADEMTDKLVCSQTAMLTVASVVANDLMITFCSSNPVAARTQTQVRLLL